MCEKYIESNVKKNYSKGAKYFMYNSPSFPLSISVIFIWYHNLCLTISMIFSDNLSCTLSN